MTIHKSHGSQYDEVAVVLAGRASPAQTRELIYTGLTRASEAVRWVGTEEELALALHRGVGRMSALWAMVGEARG
ncbi:MAG: ATP-binding domain-containing protein [Deltaproteobacteria bacterium]|nr:ATP-binding domain-containing protein [Deltaproteobacteria bacterium]